MTRLMTPAPRLTCSHGPVSAVDLALFAAASGDHNPLHLDATVAQAAGFERPVVHGMYTMAVIARLFAQACGAGRVRSLRTRFTGSALLGDTLVVEAALDEQDDGQARYRVSARTAAGTELVVGVAVVQLE